MYDRTLQRRFDHGGRRHPQPNQLRTHIFTDLTPYLPLADIRNLRRVTTVVKAGRVYDPARLWKMVGFQP